MEFKQLKSLEVYLQSLVEGRLWQTIAIALLLGAGVGVVLSPATGWASERFVSTLGEWLALPGKLFMKLIQMIMIPLIFASIVTGFVNTSIEQLKRLGLGVGLYFLATTTIAILLGIVLMVIMHPGTLMQETLPDGDIDLSSRLDSAPHGIADIPGVITDMLPDNPLASMVSGEMLAIVIFTIIIGISVVQLSNESRKPVLRFLSAIQEICMTVVKWAMRLVPYAVFGLMAQLTMSIGISSLKGIGLYITTVIVGLLLLLVLYVIIASTIGRQKPFDFLKKIREVQLMAFSTTSSAAVMPLSLKTAEDKLGIDRGISNVIIPIGTTINMDGTAITQCISTLFILQTYGIDVSAANAVLVVFTIVAASIGTPAIPGGGIVILASMLRGMGVPVEGVFIVVGVDRILGMFRAAINVTGDIAACTVFDRLRETRQVVGSRFGIGRAGEGNSGK